MASFILALVALTAFGGSSPARDPAIDDTDAKKPETEAATTAATDAPTKPAPSDEKTFFLEGVVYIQEKGIKGVMGADKAMPFINGDKNELKILINGKNTISGAHMKLNGEVVVLKNQKGTQCDVEGIEKKHAMDVPCDTLNFATYETGDFDNDGNRINTSRMNTKFRNIAIGKGIQQKIGAEFTIEAFYNKKPWQGSCSISHTKYGEGKSHSKLSSLSLTVNKNEITEFDSNNHDNPTLKLAIVITCVNEPTDEGLYTQSQDAIKEVSQLHEDVVKMADFAKEYITKTKEYMQNDKIKYTIKDGSIQDIMKKLMKSGEKIQTLRNISQTHADKVKEATNELSQIQNAPPYPLSEKTRLYRNAVDVYKTTIDSRESMIRTKKNVQALENDIQEKNPYNIYFEQVDEQLYGDEDLPLYGDSRM